MARAARLVLAAISEASSMVRSGSWLMTDMTMLIMTCRRRIFLASSWASLRFPPCAPCSEFSMGPPNEDSARPAGYGRILIIGCASAGAGSPHPVGPIVAHCLLKATPFRALDLEIGRAHV